VFLATDDRNPWPGADPPTGEETKLLIAVLSSTSMTCFLGTERPGFQRWPMAIATPAFEKSDTPVTARTRSTPADGAPNRGAEPPTQVVGRNQPGFIESVDTNLQKKTPWRYRNPVKTKPAKASKLLQPGML